MTASHVIKGFHKPLCMVAGVEDADAVFFLGYHARTGDSDGVGNQTILGREIVEIRLNGQAVGESEINAAVCGQFGAFRVVTFASGDDLYEEGTSANWPQTAALISDSPTGWPFKRTSTISRPRIVSLPTPSESPVRAQS